MTNYRLELGFDFNSVNDLSVPYFNPTQRARLIQDGLVNLDQGNSPAWYTGFETGDTLAFDLFDVTADAENAPLDGAEWKRELISLTIFFGNPHETREFLGGEAPAPASPASKMGANPFEFTQPYATRTAATSYVFGGQSYPHYPISDLLPQQPLALDTPGRYVLAIQFTIEDLSLREQDEDPSLNEQKIFSIDPEPIVGGTSFPG